MTPLIWQVIEQQERPSGSGPGMVWAAQSHRARVPNGWLARPMVLHRETTLPTGGVADIETNVSVGLTFVSDPGNVSI